MFGGRYHVAGRGIDDDHAGLGGGFDVDVVNPHTGACDHAQSLAGMDHLGGHLGGAAHQEGVVVADHFDQFLLRLPCDHVYGQVGRAWRGARPESDIESLTKTANFSFIPALLVPREFQLHRFGALTPISASVFLSPTSVARQRTSRAALSGSFCGSTTRQSR